MPKLLVLNARAIKAFNKAANHSLTSKQKGFQQFSVRLKTSKNRS